MGDRYFSKYKIMLSVFFFILILFSSVVNGAISLLPAKLKIDIKDFEYGEITYDRITVKNPYDYDIYVVSEVKEPPGDSLTGGYSVIPDASWINVSPDKLLISANSEGYFSINVDIPGDVKNDVFDKRWEVWASFFESRSSRKGGISLNVKVATKVLIHTPKRSLDEGFSFSFLWMGLFFVLVFVIFLFVFMIRRGSSKKPFIFYFRRNK